MVNDCYFPGTPEPRPTSRPGPARRPPYPGQARSRPRSAPLAGTGDTWTNPEPPRGPSPAAATLAAAPADLSHQSPLRPEGNGPIHDDPSVLSLLTRAQAGDQQAWDTLVDWYAPLIWSICRRYRLAAANAGDIGRTVWLRLADQLDTIDPATLPGWLATATA